MATVDIDVLIPVQDTTQSVETAEVTSDYKKAVTTAADGVKIKKALDNKNNSLQIYIENTYTTADSTATIKAGDHYPNKVLGDLNVTLTKATAGADSAPDVPTLTVVLLEDISRFENKDGSVKITFSTNFTGNVWAVAKRAGIKPVPTT